MDKFLYWHVSAYRFVPLSKLKVWKTQLLNLCSQFDAQGTILISEEGINISATLSSTALMALQRYLDLFPETRNLYLKPSIAQAHLFSRMLVRIKKAIIPFPANATKKPEYIDASQLDSNYQNYMLLDVRNDYEYRIGSFANATHMNIKKFVDLKEQLEEAPQSWKAKDVVIFCTGGVRCEKVAPLMDNLGFKSVKQLKGGILEYLRHTNDSHWEGDCFTFDRRVSFTQKLRPGPHKLCFNCRSPLSEEDTRSPLYTEEKSCPYCATNTPQEKAPI